MLDAIAVPGENNLEDAWGDGEHLNLSAKLEGKGWCQDLDTWHSTCSAMLAYTSVAGELTSPTASTLARHQEITKYNNNGFPLLHAIPL